MSNDVFRISEDVVRYAQRISGKPIPNNFAFSLTDYIQFAIKRQQEHIQVKLPFAYEIEHLYDTELRIGRYALRRIKEELKVCLPKEEATGIALHFINNYQQYSVGEDTEAFDRLLEYVLRIIEDGQGINIDRTSYDCYRFSMHLRYFMERAKKDALYFEDREKNREKNIELAMLCRRYYSYSEGNFSEAAFIHGLREVLIISRHAAI